MHTQGDIVISWSALSLMNENSVKLEYLRACSVLDLLLTTSAGRGHRTSSSMY
jgi:hypothetical protein